MICGEGLRRLGVPGRGAHVTNHCGLCGSATHGRPLLSPIPGILVPHVSISYAADLTVVALTEAGGVGVDVERSDAASFPSFDAVVAHKNEGLRSGPTETITWVRKESLLKATGRGLTVDPRLILLTEPGESPALVEWAAPHPPQTSVWMLDVETTSKHVTAVTVLSEDQPEIVARRADLVTPVG